MMNKKKSTLGKRYQSSYESKDGKNNGSVMNYGDVEFFSPKVGKNHINIIPYEIKTKNHPLVIKGDMSVGDMDYVMDLFIHKNIGPAQSSIICLKKNFEKPCPICEQADKFKKEGKEDEAKALYPTRRVFYNVEDLSDGKLKVFEASHYLFEKELIDEARDDEEGGFINFADPDEGKEIKFRAIDVQKGTIKYKEFKSFSFTDREDSISEDLLDNAISFDEIMKIPTYADAERALYGNVSEEDDDEEEFEEKPKKSNKKEVEEDDDEVDEQPTKAKPIKSNEEDEGCPFGHRFAKDCDKFEDDCDKCDKWDDCYKKGE